MGYLESVRNQAVLRGLIISVVASLFVATPVLAIVSIDVGTNDGMRGGELTLTMSLEREEGDSAVSTAQTDIFFDTQQIDLMGQCSDSQSPCQLSTDCSDDASCDLPCTKDPRLIQSFGAFLPEFQNVPSAGLKRMRLAVLSTLDDPSLPPFPIRTFEDGVLATCTFDIASDARLGEVFLAAERFEVGDDLAEPADSQVRLSPGMIFEILNTPTASPTATATGGTFTPTATGGTFTPTATGGDVYSDRNRWNIYANGDGRDVHSDRNRWNIYANGDGRDVYSDRNRWNIYANGDRWNVYADDYRNSRYSDSYRNDRFCDPSGKQASR